MNSASNGDELFESEIKGLKLLNVSKTIKIPNVIHSSKVGNVSFLLLEYIEKGIPTNDFWTSFGYQLAAMHKTSNDYFGLDSNNFIGSLPQQNIPKDNWIDFFICERIQPQINLAISLSLIETKTINLFEKLFTKLKDIFPKESPSLIHGDLWNGNFLADQENQPVIFDPSVSYSHREMDLAMSLLFGGFGNQFYQSYNDAFPLEKGFQSRVEIYQLYYLMVHVNIFGSSYLSSVKNILSRHVE